MNVSRTARRIGVAALLVAGTATAGVAVAVPASASSTRVICADSVTVRYGDNQPIGYLYHGDHFQLDHYSPSGTYAVGVGTKSTGEQLSGYVIANTITDAGGNCQSPYS